jgi:cytoskeleton protein RodZ
MVLRARTAEVWVQIRERAGGPVLVDRVLRPGESLEAPPGKPGLVLATGNAGALEVLIGAETTAIGLGPGPSVRRNIPLEPERLRSAAAPTPATPVSAGPAPAAAASRPATPQ